MGDPLIDVEQSASSLPTVELAKALHTLSGTNIDEFIRLLYLEINNGNINQAVRWTESGPDLVDYIADLAQVQPGQYERVYASVRDEIVDLLARRGRELQHENFSSEHIMGKGTIDSCVSKCVSFMRELREPKGSVDASIKQLYDGGLGLLKMNLDQAALRVVSLPQ